MRPVASPVPCSRCESPARPFSVPAPLREHAPDGAPEASICVTCLALDTLSRDVDGPPVADAEFEPLPFPDGEGGVAVALAVGMLESLALNRPAIEACIDHAERNGADVFLVLDRLAAPDADVDPSFDPARRKAQLENLL